LTFLDLSANKINDSSFTGTEPFETMLKVKWDYFRFLDFSPPSFPPSSLLKTSNLRTLDLSFNSITGPFIQGIGDVLTKGTSLSTLNLR
jgi:Leucine-rich repeat (LRR) protein